MNNKIYDVEDDIIDRGDATNLSEALDYYNIDNVYQTDIITSNNIEQLNQKIEQDYHNTYYKTNTKSYGTRTIKLANKDWHKLNKV